jgi:hypothetical protein
MWIFAESHFSKARLAKYFRQSGGQIETALALYRLNGEISSAFWEAISYLEVAFRNRIDKKLTARHISLQRAGHWLDDNYFELGRTRNDDNRSVQPYQSIKEAISRVERNRKKLTADQVVSELSLGFWIQMVSKKQQFLWPELASGFPNAPTRDQRYISNLGQEIRILRNRIGHHHRLSANMAKTAEKTILQLAYSIDEELMNFIQAKSRIPHLMAELDAFEKSSTGR